MKNFSLLGMLIFNIFLFNAQIPDGYYDDAENKTGYELKTALKNIIDDHKDNGYDYLYTIYKDSDTDSYYENNGTVLDMYSEKPGETDAYEYTHINDECGNYGDEGDCYNREHLMPQSIFNSESPMKSDAHFVVPSDGYVNGKRSNYPFGIVDTADWTSSNGSKVGSNATSGYSGTVFEPIDEFKGDIARMLFYVATRYEDVIGSWEDTDMLDGTSDHVFSDWFLEILLQWHEDDPVSQREIDRNEAVYDYQENRNPFIDHPEWVSEIWGSSSSDDNNENTSYCIDEDFVDWDDWTNNGAAEDTSSSHYGNDSPCLAMGENDYIISPTVDNPNTLEFYQDASSGGDGETATIDYSINNGDWVEFYSFSADSDGATENIDLTNLNGVDLSSETNVRFRFNSSFYTWYLDDVKVSCGSNNSSSSDNDTEALAPDTQIGGTTVYSTDDTTSEAVEVFKINISDEGTSDGLATLVTNIRLKPKSSNTADWTDVIQGFIINAGGNNVTPSNTTVTDTYIDFEFTSGDISIADGTTQTISFSVYLNTSDIVDQSILSFMIDADNHGFTADSSNGSDFADTFSNGDIISADFVIDVSVTELRFLQQPSTVEVSNIMSPAVTVAATDENGNIDTEFTGSGTAVGLTTTGSFDASATTQVDAVNGVATFDHLIFDTTGSDITLTTTDPDNWGYTNTTSNSFDVIEESAGGCASELIISEYIEGSGNNKYLEFYNGTGNDINLDDYEIRIYFNGSSSAGKTIPLNNYNLTDGTTFVIVNSGAEDTTMANQESDNLTFNGDDAVELYNTATNKSVDIIGEIGEDPGSAWGSGSVTTANHTLVRKMEITQGDSNGNDTFDPADEWDGYEQDDISHLGSHTMDCAECETPTTDAVFASNSPENISGISATLNWTNGNGEKRIVIIREATEVTFTPVDETTYTSNSTFGSGTDISGNNEYIVYNDTGNSVTISGLSAGHTYYVKIFEYNCNNGREKYYTSGTPASDVFVTVPNNPTDFNTGCISNTQIELNWTEPASSEFDGYLLVVREGNENPHDVSGYHPTAISANTDYSEATEYGDTDPKSRFLYVGTDNATTVTGLTQGTEYTFEIFTYVIVNNEYQYSTGLQNTQTIALNQVSDAHATPANSKATIYWINPECYDEILVVANETAGIDFTPSGDGSNYNADTSYTSNNQVVYKDNSNVVVVDNLTNNTTYYFEIFVRKGTEWSPGIEVSATPVEATEYQPGQLIFVGYDGLINGSGADDEYLIATLIDMKPQTTFSLVNSRYEAGAPANVRTDKWGGAGDDASTNPGVAEITYTGTSNIPAGSIIKLRVDYSTSFITYVGIIENTTETDHTNDFSASLVYGDTSIPNISSSGSDQIYLIQGVYVFDGTEDPEQANYKLQGTLLHGITNRASWVEISDACNGDDSGGNTRESRLHPSLNCFNVENNDSSAISGFYQNDKLHSGSFRDIILSISNVSNWTLGTDRYNLDPSTTNETDAGHTFSISGGHNPGTWVSSSDTNWFNCSNWETLAVPDATTDVYIDANSSVNAVIDNSALYADLFNGVAECNNLEISNLNLQIEGEQSLVIHGNLNIESGGTLDADDGDETTKDADIHIQGNWTNADKNNFIEGNSTVIFEGTTQQIVEVANGNQTEEFYNLTIDNSAGVKFISGNIHATHDLNIINSPAINITDYHYLLAGHNLQNDSQIVVENEGSLVQTDNSGTITGSGTFQLNKTSMPLNYYYDYVYWSSPIVSGHLTLGDIRNDAWRYYKFDPTIVNDPGQLYPGWVILSSSDIADTGVGYAISAPENHTYGETISASFIKDNDPFNNGLITVNVYNKTGDGGDNNLLGNPYPSAIDFNQFANDNSAIDGSYSLWTKCAGLDSEDHHQQDGYTTYTVSGGNGTAVTACNGNGETATQYIASTQGFMVIANTDNATVTFSNTHRVTGNNNNFLNRPGSRDIVWINMTNDNGGFSQIAVGLYPGATDNYDRMYDAKNPNAGSGFVLSSLLNDKKLAIQGLAPIDTADKIIPLSIENNTTQNIHFAIDHVEGFEDTDIYLKDLQSGTYHNLKTDAYTTSVDAGEINEGFEIVFSKAVNALEMLTNNNSVSLTQNNGIFNLQTTHDNVSISNLWVFNTNGQLLFEDNKIRQNQYQINLQHVAKGMLLFKIKLDDHKTIVIKTIKK